MPIITVSSKGQVVIPRRVREQVGLTEGSHVRVDAVHGAIVLKPVTVKRSGWRRWRGAFAGERLLAVLAEDHRREIETDRRVRS